LYALEDTAETQIRHGPEVILLRWMELREPWEESVIEAEELVDAGDYVVAALHVRNVIRDTQDAVEMRFSQTFAFRDGRITQIRGFRTFAEALEAAGRE
jgi:ketosteroid isomerase-like protein